MPGSTGGASDEQRKRRQGLCASCEHAQRVVSSRGSEFLLCGRSKTDNRYARYPPLPVLGCPGFEPKRT